MKQGYTLDRDKGKFALHEFCRGCEHRNFDESRRECPTFDPEWLSWSIVMLLKRGHKRRAPEATTKMDGDTGRGVGADSCVKRSPLVANIAVVHFLSSSHAE
ncbi:hypothetical protein MRX96_038692 [Rhipicephalus microplus]